MKGLIENFKIVQHEVLDFVQCFLESDFPIRPIVILLQAILMLTKKYFNEI